GPGFKEQWCYWRYATDEQKRRSAVQSELSNLLKMDTVHPAHLTQDELTAVRKNLQTRDIDVDQRFIKETWEPLYKLYFLERALIKARECRKCFSLYHQGNLADTGLDC